MITQAMEGPLYNFTFNDTWHNTLPVTTELSGYNTPCTIHTRQNSSNNTISSSNVSSKYNTPNQQKRKYSSSSSNNKFDFNTSLVYDNTYNIIHETTSTSMYNNINHDLHIDTSDEACLIYNEHDRKSINYKPEPQLSRRIKYIKFTFQQTDTYSKPCSNISIVGCDQHCVNDQQQCCQYNLPAPRHINQPHIFTFNDLYNNHDENYNNNNYNIYNLTLDTDNIDDNISRNYNISTPRPHKKRKFSWNMAAHQL